MTTAGFAVPFRTGPALPVLVDGTGPGPVLVCGHGSNGGPTHPVLALVAARLALAGCTVLRCTFPFHAEGRRNPNTDAVLRECLETVWDAVQARYPGQCCLLGGKSLGARIAAAVAARLEPRPAGLVLLGYPLHAPGRHATALPEPLGRPTVPTLVVQGTRDPFGTPEELAGPEGERPGLLAVMPVSGGDHSFRRAGDENPGTKSPGHAGGPETAADLVAAWISREFPDCRAPRRAR